MFSGGCVSFDHASGFMSIKQQVAMNATEYTKAKITIEREDQSQILFIKEFHTGNGVFNALDFMEELLKNQQNIGFGGAGASYQNGALYHAIKTVVTTEMTMLVHAALRCAKETLSTHIWPIKMDYSV